MKNILIYTVLTSSLFIGISCSRDKISETNIKKTFVNRSSYDIKMLVYAEDTLDFQVPIDDSVVFEGKYYSGPGIDYLDVGWYDPSHVTGQVIFNNEKELIYDSSDDCDDQNRNPLSSFFGTGFTCGFVTSYDAEGIITYTYSFTDVDYQNARPLGG